MTRPLWGKYRGRVVDATDPLARARLMAEVPALNGVVLGWALPCAPWPGDGPWPVPPVGASVWIEFEGGDPDYPIWAGCFPDEDAG